MRNRIRASLTPSAVAATVIGGDFNFVVAKGDRRALETMADTGGKDTREEDRWQRRVAKPLGLLEMRQDDMTHHSARSESRLDRIYANFPLIDQLDKVLRMTVLPWRLELSAHMPISFHRTTAPKKAPNGVSQAALRHKDFPRRTRLAFLEFLRSAPDADAIDRLVLF